MDVHPVGHQVAHREGHLARVHRIGEGEVVELLVGEDVGAFEPHPNSLDRVDSDPELVRQHPVISHLSQQAKVGPSRAAGGRRVVHEVVGGSDLRPHGDEYRSVDGWESRSVDGWTGRSVDGWQ
ncbi:MAG: hypothetical protein ACK559_07795 [bacterium]